MAADVCPIDEPYWGVGAISGCSCASRYSVEHLIAMNTPGRADGVILGWVDIYKSAAPGKCADSDVWPDQMVLATDSPIGPIRSGAAQPTQRMP
jgi:hypothetical protein